MPSGSRRDDLLGVVAVILLLIGTAIDNAYVLLGLSLTALILFPVFCSQQMRSGAILVAFVAAMAATLIGIVGIAMR